MSRAFETGHEQRVESTRLTVARFRRRLSKRQLAERLNVSAELVGQWESAKKRVPLERIAQLSAELGFPESFFTRPALDISTIERAAFRGASRLPAPDRYAAGAAALLAVDIDQWLSGRFKRRPLIVPDVLDLGVVHDVEDAANGLRGALGLGAAPLPSLIRLLEYAGVRVYSLDGESAKVDAFSFWNQETAYVLLTLEKSAERSRFDAAHELAHIVLHRSLEAAPRDAGVEKEANAFASALLMPRSALLSEVPRSPSLAELIELKRRWKVSLAALIYRLRAIGHLDDELAEIYYRQMSANGWLRRTEPSPIQRERSHFLQRAFEELESQGIRRRSIAEELGIGVETVSALTFGPRMSRS